MCKNQAHGLLHMQLEPNSQRHDREERTSKLGRRHFACPGSVAEMRLRDQAIVGLASHTPDVSAGFPEGLASGVWSANGRLGRLFELVRGGPSGNLVPMEGLRGVAVALVFLVHYFTLIERHIAAGKQDTAMLEGIRAIGHTGVDLFFVISGYLIYGTLISRSHDYVRFMARRVRRIYPTFLAVFGIYLVLSIVLPSVSRLPQDLLAAAIYVTQNLLLLPGLWPVEPLVTVAWSLSYEMFFYLVTPLVVGVLGLRQCMLGTRVSLLLAATALLMGYCALYGGHVRLSLFLAGALLFECARAWPRRSAPPALAMVVLVLALALCVQRADGSMGYALRTLGLYVAFSLVCSAAFGRPASWLARGLSWTPLRWLGNMSYSYYLVHGLALSALAAVVTKIFGAVPLGWPLVLALMVPVFGLTLVVSAVLFLWVERPYSLQKA